MHEQLQQGTTIAISAISGMGGIGKTELALQYALKHLALKSYLGGICWLKAREDVGLQIVLFARSHINFSIPEDLELAAQVVWCWRNWEQKETLIVLDDVQQYDDIKSVLPPQKSQFKVLMTTRSRFGKPVQNYEIKVLSEGQSLELLRAIVQDQRIDHDLATAKQVCEWLGYLPLGLELVGRYLAKKKDVSIAELWQQLQAKKLSAKALLKAEPGMTASLGVTAAFELSWQDLDQDSRQLAALLSLFALAEIPWQLVEACLPEQDAEDLEDLRDDKLLGASLLERTGQGRYQLHQLLREFFRAKIGEAERKPLKTALATTMIGVAKQIPQDPTLEQIQSVTAAIPHLKEVAANLQTVESKEELYLPDDDDLSWAFIGVTRFYERQGLYAEAEPWFVACLEVVRSLLEPTHSDVVISLSNLGEIYRLQGRYEEAEPAYREALRLCKSSQGVTIVQIAAILKNLAEIYRCQGRYDDAEPLYWQSLQFYPSTMEEANLEMAPNLLSFAEFYRNQGRYDEAESICQEALRLYQSTAGETSFGVATSLNNLALIYGDQERYNEAELLYKQALELYQLLLGEAHPDVAGCLGNLAVLYFNQGRLSEAEPLFLKALKQFQQYLGDQHPDTVGTRQSLKQVQQILVRDGGRKKGRRQKSSGRGFGQ